MLHLMENDYCAPFNLAQPTSFELARMVASITPEEINHVFFTNSGSESDRYVAQDLRWLITAPAAKDSARASCRGNAPITASTSAAHHLSGMVKNRETFSGVMPNVVCMRHTWLEENRFTRGQPEHGAELAEDLAAYGRHLWRVDDRGVLTSSRLPGSTGTLVPPKGYLQRLREICDANGILLVFDEVICGFGRLGVPFAAQAFGVTPDIMTMAKALTNGAQPMGAVAVRDEIYETIVNCRPRRELSNCSMVTPTRRIRPPALQASPRRKSIRMRSCSNARTNCRTISSTRCSHFRISIS